MHTASGCTKTGTSLTLRPLDRSNVPHAPPRRGTRRGAGEPNREEEEIWLGVVRFAGTDTRSVYYLPLAMLALATSVARPNLVSLGTCFGKFSKTGKFKLGITCLDWLAKYAKYKVRDGPFVMWDMLAIEEAWNQEGEMDTDSAVTGRWGGQAVEGWDPARGCECLDGPDGRAVRGGHLFASVPTRGRIPSGPEDLLLQDSGSGDGTTWEGLKPSQSGFRSDICRPSDEPGRTGALRRFTQGESTAVAAQHHTVPATRSPANHCSTAP